ALGWAVLVSRPWASGRPGWWGGSGWGAGVGGRRGGGGRRPPAPPPSARRTVYLFVDNFDLAAVAALRYARSLRPTTLTAVHFVIDSAQAATLRRAWLNPPPRGTLDFIYQPHPRPGPAPPQRVTAPPDTPHV